MSISRSSARSWLRFAVVVALTLVPALAAAQSPPDRFAVVHIDNNTKNITIHYEIRWGSKAEWKAFTIEPGERWTHSYAYDYDNQNSSPTLQIHFWTGINRKRTEKLYDLDRYACPTKEKGGKVYYFEKRTDGDGEDYLELFAAPKEQPTAKNHGKKVEAIATADKKPIGEPAAPANDLYKQGLESAKNKQYDQAIEFFTRAIAQDGSHDRAFVERAAAYYRKGQLAKALEDCSAALALNAKNALAYNVRGWIYTDRAEYEKALADFSTAIGLNGKLAGPHFNRGKVYYTKGDYAKASVDFSSAIQLYTDPLWLSSSFNWRGLCHLKTSKYEAAFADFDQAIQRNPNNASAYSNRGAVSYKMGAYQSAVKDCEEAIRLNAELAAPYRWRSQAYAKLGMVALAKSDYAKAVAISPEQKALFKFTSFLVDRQEAFQALEAFPLGGTLTPKKLQALNELPGGEMLDAPAGKLSKETKALIASETTRLAALEFEMVAAADLLLRAALLSAEQRAAKGWKLSWLFGPVTAPPSLPFARWVSKDGLAGLRVIGRLELPKGQQINVIVGVMFQPPRADDFNDPGKVSLLPDVDNFRLQVRLFGQGNTKTDYAFQSFAIAGEGLKMTMRPRSYIDAQTGMLVDSQLASMALGTSCINCHLSGPKLKADQLALMQAKDYQRMEGFKDFLEQMRHFAAGKEVRQKMEEIMKTKGPAALLPLEEMFAANREHWLAIYPRLEKAKN